MYYTTSVIGFKYANGTVIASDTQVSYGNRLSHYENKIFSHDTSLAMAISGAVSDSACIKDYLAQQIEKDKQKLGGNQIFRILQKFLYQKRSRMAPLSVSVLVADTEKLSVINSKGCHWSDSCAATGFAAHFLLPIIRSRDTEQMSRDEAFEFVRNLFRIAVHKDKMSSNRIQIVSVDKNDGFYSTNEKIDTNWDSALFSHEISL